ncbi:hypothetical protein EIN_526300 [Entamoeba invadens IP1]|uniref:Leucine rich repeat containing protein BspA family protein n=1 Tax=Entamoeba invadens IP1 TaxID=370355 RepID=A0A0A1U5S4_ENTIV|nr:hypothetical protein EIN_526300 [Entamoeba invadens IP1]ELP89605.1 hypothetical protein EIN_526300 [Entamoeba invadens IP1]|eukprot:XP_004256376.1 hypothetical protein EIN_526300 [Entamoeba invadens IP1]
MIISQYFVSVNDMFKLTLVCQKFKEIPNMFHYNPFPITKHQLTMFPHIETFHFYNKTSFFQTKIRVCIHFEISFATKLQLEKKYGKTTQFTRVVLKEEEAQATTIFTIPKSVTVLGLSTFALRNFMKLILPNNIHEIHENCFSQLYCQNIVIPTTVTFIDSRAFSFCMIKTITIHNGLYLNENAFDEDFLEEIILPYPSVFDGLATEKMEKILKKNGVFCRNVVATKLNIKNGVVKIKKNAVKISDGYAQNTGFLSQIVFGESVREIGEYAFFNCCGLTSLNLPTTIRTLGVGCFSKNKDLVEVTIPKSIHRIPSACFKACFRLSKIHFESKISSFGKNWMKDTKLDISDTLTNSEETDEVKDKNFLLRKYYAINAFVE